MKEKFQDSRKHLTRRNKPTEAESWLAMPGARETQGKWIVTSNGYRISFWDNKNVLELVVTVVPFYKHANDYRALKTSKFYGM